MTNGAQTTSGQVKIEQNAAINDGLQAAARYIGVLITFLIAVLGLLKVHDIAGLITLVQSNGGQVLAAISGLVSLVLAAYGVFKSRKRGSQLVTAAADPRNRGVEFKQ